MLGVAWHAKGLQVVQMVEAAQRGVPTLARHAMVDLKAVRAPPQAPDAQRGGVAGRTLGRSVAATNATPAVAALSRPARHGPPVVAPEVVAARRGAPTPSSARKRGAAPAAAARSGTRPRAVGEQNRALPAGGLPHRDIIRIGHDLINEAVAAIPSQGRSDVDLSPGPGLQAYEVAVQEWLSRSRQADLESAGNAAVADPANDALEADSCRPFAAVKAISPRAKAVKDYMKSLRGPESATKSARVLSARDSAVRRWNRQLWRGLSLPSLSATGCRIFGECPAYSRRLAAPDRSLFAQARLSRR